jgi:hypothetical protein
MSPWEKLLERPNARGHFVQLYDADELALANNVARYAWEGLRRGDGVLIIATREHWDLFSRQLTGLGADSQSLLDSSQLVLLDAQNTLARFMAAGQPDWRLFEGILSAAMQQVKPAHVSAGLRAYGEMVGILWKARQFAAAIRLENFWNKLLEQSSFSLYCAYCIDLFGKEFHVGALDEILCTHSHLVPAQPNGHLETALNLAMDEMLGREADALRILIKANYRPSWAIMPNAEAMVLWLRRNLPERADDIVSRSRHYYNRLLQQDNPLIAGG